MATLLSTVISRALMPLYGSFDRRAKSAQPADWDRVDWRLMDARHGCERMIKVLGLLPRDGLNLDLGAGAGHGASLAAEKTVCFGLDYGRESTRLAKDKGLAMVQADGRALPFADHAFDSITCLDVLEHLPRAGELVREAARVLKPGGRLILVTPTRELLSERLGALVRDWGLVEQMQPYDRPYGQDEVRGMIEAAGLNLDHSRVMANWAPNPLLRLIARTRLFVCSA